MKGSLHYIWPGLFQFEDMSLLLHLLRPGDSFADVGANIGAFTVLASKVCGAKTTAFEPGELAFQALQDNVLLNGLGSLVDHRRCAVGDFTGKIDFVDGLGTESRAASRGDSIKTISVDMIDLDRAAPECGFVALKIDTEGFETKVIAGALGVLKNPVLKVIILERASNSLHYGIDEAQLDAVLHQQGFASYKYSPETRTLTPTEAKSGGCVIYIRDIDFVVRRVGSAPKIRFNHLVW